MANIRRDRFLKIASNRTNKVIDDIRLLSNCGNTNNYEYTKEEVEKMFKAIEVALDDAKSKFDFGSSKERFKFWWKTILNL